MAQGSSKKKYFLNNLKMKLKHAFSFLVLSSFFLLVLLSLSINYYSSKMEENSKMLLDSTVSVRISETLIRKLLRFNREVFLYDLYGSSLFSKKSMATLDEFNYWLKEIQLYVNSEKEKELFKEVSKSIEAFFSQRKLLTSQKVTPLEKYQQLGQYLDEANDKIAEFTELKVSFSEGLKVQSQIQNAHAKNISIIAISMAFIFTVLCFLAVYLKVYMPIEKIQIAIEDFKNDKTVAKLETKSVKEINLIASNFNTLVDMIQKRKSDQLSFLASIVHDLRNPLNTILLSSQMLKEMEKNNLDKTSENILNIIVRQIMSLSRIVSDLLDMTQIEAGKLELIFKKVNISEVIMDIITLNDFTGVDSKIIFENKEVKVFCECDETRIGQVVNNLVSNAIKYSPASGPVKITLSCINAIVIISVIDKGVGIDSSDLEKLFKPFSRGKKLSSEIRGIGLGLSSSKKIIEGHGGNIEVQSVPGLGSTFTVKIPQFQLKGNDAQVSVSKIA